MNNQEYVRTRRQKSVNKDATYSRTTQQPKCPVLYTDHLHDEVSKITNTTVLLVDGDEWYSVTANGFFKNIMEKRSRTWKAGPSGSTFMWMNMVFGLLGYAANDSNYKLLLLCIIADFVPIYHSLSEILMIYSREYPNIQSNYNIDQNPIKWLMNHFEIEDKANPTLETLFLSTQNKPIKEPLQELIELLETKIQTLEKLQNGGRKSKKIEIDMHRKTSNKQRVKKKLPTWKSLLSK